MSPEIAPGTAEIKVGTNNKSDQYFYAPVNWKENGVCLNELKSGVR